MYNWAVVSRANVENVCVPVVSVLAVFTDPVEYVPAATGTGIHG
jgi:hypothetical protein